MGRDDGKQGWGKYAGYAIILIACAIFYFTRGDDVLAWITLSIGLFSSSVALMYLGHFGRSSD